MRKTLCLLALVMTTSAFADSNPKEAAVNAFLKNAHVQAMVKEIKGPLNKEPRAAEAILLSEACPPRDYEKKYCAQKYMVSVIYDFTSVHGDFGTTADGVIGVVSLPSNEVTNVSKTADY